MAIYSAGLMLPFSDSVASAPIPLMQIVSSPSDWLCILEFNINVFGGPASALSFGLSRGTSNSTGPVSYARQFVAEDPNVGQAPYYSLYTDWVGRPSTPAQFFRRTVFLGTSGSNWPSRPWTFPRGLIVTPVQALTVWQITASAANASPPNADIQIRMDA